MLDQAPPRCPGCDRAICNVAPRARHRSTYNDQTYTLHECVACGQQFWWPLKIDPLFYETEGFAAYEDYHAGTRPFPRWAEPLFHPVPISEGRVLDIGCGDGSVLHRLAAAAIEPYGIDLDQKSIEIAKRRHGLKNLQASTLEDYIQTCEAGKRTFDLVTFFEVLEHQDNPKRFLAQVIRLLAPGGVIAGSVPNRHRFLAALDRRLASGDLPPHHFLWFSVRSLSGLLQRMGFRDVTVMPAGALQYRAIMNKLARLTRKRLARYAAPLRSLLFSVVALTIIPFSSAILWLGWRRWPSHLYFKATYGAPAAPSDRRPAS
jgi:2-polyprenyl-3-methyl-5-hydroxy-6-metoxy-1,4-benzoquinol methylase